MPGEDRTNGFFVSCFIRRSANAESKVPLPSAGASLGKRARPSSNAGDDHEEPTEIDADSDESDRLATVGAPDGDSASRKRKKKNKRKKKKSNGTTPWHSTLAA